jgi:VWFA-related protein
MLCRFSKNRALPFPKRNVEVDRTLVDCMFKTLALSIFFTAAAMAQQPSQFGEKINVNLVLLDAIVTDSRGNQILGLDKNDFVVTENGAPQAIESVDYFTNRQLLTSPESQASFKAERVRDERYFVFFFDKPTEGFFDRLAGARRGAADFIDKQMKPGDNVAIVAHDVRLKVFSDFTTDKQRLKRALDEAATFSRGLQSASNAPPTGPSILRSIDLTKMISHTGTVYEGLELLGDSLRPIHARKDVILFSIGIVEPGEDIRGGMVMNTSRFYEPMIGALNRADVAVYPVNLLDNPNQPPFVHQTLERIAADTNGQYFRFNTSFTPALRRIENITNGYYLISYYTKKPSGERGFQKVNVAVRNGDFRIRARQGFSYGD